jgi:alpha-glucosidase
VPGSTFEMYREALRLRRERDLGRGSLAWLDGHEASDTVVAFRNGSTVVLANLGPGPVAPPDGAEVLLSSGPVDADGRIPTDVTVWTAARS